MLEEEAKRECKSPRLQQEFSKLKRADSPSFLAKRMNLNSNIQGSIQSQRASPLGLTINSRNAMIQKELKESAVKDFAEGKSHQKLSSEKLDTH